MIDQPCHDLALMTRHNNAELDGNQTGFKEVVGPHASAIQTNNNWFNSNASLLTYALAIFSLKTKQKQCDVEIN